MNETSCTGYKSIKCLILTVFLLLAAWFYLAHNQHMVWPGKCSAINMKVEGGEIRAAHLEGKYLAVTADFPEQHVTKVILYDYCTGTIISSVESTK